MKRAGRRSISKEAAVKAVVTAGGRIAGEYARAAGTAVKALAPVRGVTMLDAIVSSLRGAGVDRIAVVGGEEVCAACAKRVEKIVEEDSSGGENVLRALRAWPEDGEPLLYATSDLPFVTTVALRDFTSRVRNGALAVAVTEAADFAARFPGAPPSFGITLAGERVVNGGLFSIPGGSAERLGDLAVGLFRARKQPWRMATLASPLAMVRFALGCLSVAQLESLAQHALGIPAQAMRGCAPELGFDADTLAEYRYACAHA